MSLTPEWRGRVDHWRQTLESLWYTKLGDVPLEGLVTKAQLAPREALRGKFRPMPPGTAWGAKWEYAWLRGTARLPREAAGERIVFRTADRGREYFGEGRVLVNGREAGGRDGRHPEITLALRGRAGARFEVLMELYAGHGPTPCGGGPSPDGRPAVPEPPPCQRVLGEASFGIWEEELFQAWMDVRTLLEVRDLLPADSLRVAEIDAGLRDFTLLADLELPRREMLASVRAGRRRLQPLLACRNGSTAPGMDCFGHSHIDVAWLWPLQETERKCARTFSTQLALMEQYPEFVFLQSQPHLYRMTKRLYPELYARIKAAARRGQWLAEGGMWVEADTNITGGESLIRQFLHGKRFYKEEFGVVSELMWLPDVFGYSGAMPQIMAGCGIRFFSTQKIFWTYNGGDPFPYNTFWWEGIDGTRVFAHIHNDYNSETNPATMHLRWNERVQKDGLVSRMVPFGYGDGGGGPTRRHLEFLRRQADLEGMPRARMAGPVQYMRGELERRQDWPIYVGELYFQAHRGTYTTQARTKRGNRASEFALREAELWSALSLTLAGGRYPYERMDETWKTVLLNQFHDIIPGSSIRRVYEEAEAAYATAIETARTQAQAAAARLVRARANAITAFNSLSWDRAALVPLPRGWKGAESEGRQLVCQKMGSVTYAEAPVPSCGWTTLTASAAAKPPPSVEASTRGMDNGLVKLSLNTRGEIVSLVDKASGREFAAGPMNRLRMFRDVPRSFDAWDVDSVYKFQPVNIDGAATVELLSCGPLAAALRVTRAIHGSRVEQEIRLRAGSRRVEFRTRIDWREKHKLLKVCFPTNLHADEALHEVQFGHLHRPNHASRPFDADRFEVCQQKWTALAEENRGAAVLNDCKYGVSVEGGSIDLTLLRAPQAPDMLADQGIQEFAYAFTVWNGSFFDSGAIREAYELNAPVLVAPGRGGSGSMFRVDAPNVIVETVKPAEDRSGDIVVRLYEAKRAATDCALAFGFPVRAVSATNMLEEDGTRAPVRGNAVRLSFRPFEIKTLRLQTGR